MCESITLASRRYTKLLRAGQVPDIKGYKRKLLGKSDEKDGHLPLEAFIKHAMEVHVEMRLHEGRRLQEIFETCDDGT